MKVVSFFMSRTVEHKYINKIGVSSFINKGFSKKSIEYAVYLLLLLQTLTTTSVWIFSVI